MPKIAGDSYYSVWAGKIALIFEMQDNMLVVSRRQDPGQMKTLAEFTKTTLIGGLLIFLPLYVAVLLLAKSVQAILELLTPLTYQIPVDMQFLEVAAILLLVVVCFIVGLVVRTGPGLRTKNAFEQAVLEKLPGYSFLRRFVKRLTGRNEEQTLQPALVETDDALVPALIVEALEDGSFTVLTTSAPTPMAGSIYILPRERVHPVDIPLAKAIGVFSKWGIGAGEFVHAMKHPAVPLVGERTPPRVKSC